MANKNKSRQFDSFFKDDGSIHAVGNGRIMAYGRGPEWIQVIGPPYSSPTALKLTIPSGDHMKSSSKREPCTNIWNHTLDGGTITDCAPREISCLARHWELHRPVRFFLDFCGFQFIENSIQYQKCTAAYLITVPGGIPIYNWYPTRDIQRIQLLIRGNASIESIEGGLMLTLDGTGELILLGDSPYPRLVSMAQKAYYTPWKVLASLANQDGMSFTRRRHEKQLPLKDHALRSCVELAADDVATLIRAQQDVGGGVQAGHNYHLAYVRDQYGVSRGLLAMGCWEEAKAILKFYKNVFTQWGFIGNAQGMGVPGLFHIHENDQVEITGYLIMQSLDMLRVTGDRELFHGLRPLMDWALTVQLNNLHNGMLPFNGDETYIAGGLIPRSVLNHGSLEATMLMVRSGEEYINWCHTSNTIQPWMEDAFNTLQMVRKMYESNFKRGDIWVANSLKRLDGLQEPPFRHGVCNACGAFGWTQYSQPGFYVCPECMTKGEKLSPFTQQEYQLNSVVLMAPYVNSDMLPQNFVSEQIKSYLAAYRSTGQLPSRPDGNTCLGYDFGLLLYAARNENLLADDLLTHMLSIQDDAGAWVEYYVNNEPSNTRCRPWESAINIEGALHYLHK